MSLWRYIRARSARLAPLPLAQSVSVSVPPRTVLALLLEVVAFLRSMSQRCSQAVLGHRYALWVRRARLAPPGPGCETRTWRSRVQFVQCGISHVRSHEPSSSILLLGFLRESIVVRRMEIVVKCVFWIAYCKVSLNFIRIWSGLRRPESL